MERGVLIRGSMGPRLIIIGSIRAYDSAQGGLIMEPPAGGVSAEAVRIALGYGYGPPFGSGVGARFISLPTHHTRNIARQERRTPVYVEACLEIPDHGELPGDLPEILDLVAMHDAVLNTGHITGLEAVRLAELLVTVE